MNFKKMSQLIWMLLAFFFIVVLFLHVYSESVYIVKLSSDYAWYIKFNKLTNQIDYADFTGNSTNHNWQRY